MLKRFASTVYNEKSDKTWKQTAHEKEGEVREQHTLNDLRPKRKLHIFQSCNAQIMNSNIIHAFNDHCCDSPT